MKKNFLSGMLGVTIAAMMLAGCSGNSAGTQDTTAPQSADTSTAENKTEKTAAAETITVDFWSGPEQMYYDMWSDYAQKFNAAGITLDNGTAIEVKVQQMPGQPSAEAGIQNAIATKTAPAASENLNISFAGTLANSDVICDIGNEQWFKDIVAERSLGSIIEGWDINGSQYVLPEYVNPMVLQYNVKALKALGAEVPTTLDELNVLMDKFETQKAEMAAIGVTHFMYRYELTRPDSWWERWFDFESFYKAFSGGDGLVDGNTLTMDPTISQEIFEMYGRMGKSLLIGEIPQFWQQDTVQAVMGIGIPWEITANDAAGKVYGEDYVFGPMITKTAGADPFCYADTKGIVLYKTENISEDQHQGAIEFLKWVFLDGGKDTFDVDWLGKTSMLPVRGDLDSYAPVVDYLQKSPGLSELSKYVAYARPGMAHTKEGVILTALAEAGLTPYIMEEVASAEPGSTVDAAAYVEKAIEAMKAAGGMD